MLKLCVCAIVALRILFQDEVWLGWGGEFVVVGIYELVEWVEFVGGGSDGIVVRFEMATSYSWYGEDGIW